MEIQTVSVCLLARNEEKYLPGILADIAEQTYPRQLTELILVDSCSEDGTLAILTAFRQNYLPMYRNIRILKNDGIIQASGWNTAIRAASCDAVARIDAHCHLPREYIAHNMRNLQNGEAVSGGICQMACLEQSHWHRTLLRAESSLFGSSIGRSTGQTQKRYVKSLSVGVYRKSVFDMVGLFNEELLRTEDNELHYRLRKAGYRLCLDPQIRMNYYCRSSLGAMLRQKYGNGYWIGYTLALCPGCISLYHLIPFGFVLGILITSMLMAAGIFLPGLLIWGAYGLLTLIFSLCAIVKDPPHRTDLMLPVLFLLMHLSYGIGTFSGLLGWLRKKR